MAEGMAILMLFALTVNVRIRVWKLEHVCSREDAAPGWAEENGQMEGGSYVDACAWEEVDAPVKRSASEVLWRLRELGKEDERIAAIAEDADRYPDQLLEALANNPEMADFAAGYPEAEHVASGELTDEEREQEHPLFLQWDPRWGYAEYGDQSVIGLAGCGPTALSMALYDLTGKEELTPDRIAAYAMANGYYMSGSGTRWALMDELPGSYGVSVSHISLEEDAWKEALDRGQVLILAMRAGDFTTEGHFIEVYGFEEDGFMVNDPNCVARSRRLWSFSELRGQVKQIWAFQALSASGFKSW